MKHVAVINLLEHLSTLLNEHGPAAPPDINAAGPILGKLAAAIETEISNHFAFE